jgi:hypothetical protein
MDIRKVIERRIRRGAPGLKVDSDVHAVVAANVGEHGATTRADSAHVSGS